MADEPAPWRRCGKAFWRAHHEAWKRSDLNQREYCVSQGLSLKAFGNWRAKFKAELQLPARRLLYRLGASQRLSHTPKSHLWSQSKSWDLSLFQAAGCAYCSTGIGRPSAPETYETSTRMPAITLNH
jgi:hypothetical protein